ncbi:MAG TPA: SCO family protein [Fimbriimonadaceae bacterium]|nr:SCO family protein [Fimbriimonadaceae bacterium]
MKGLILAGLVAMAVVAPAQQSFRDSLAQMKIDQKLGAQVPAQATFKDEFGKTIPFASLLGKRPIVLLPMFYLCQGVCGKESDNLLKTIASLQNEQVGREYDVIFLSINPKETPELAMNKKTSVLKVMKGDTNQEGYHFLTGTMPEIRKVTNAVGFGFAYDEKDGRINHPAGLMILTPSGRVSQYILGADYPKPIMEKGIALANEDKIGKEAEVVLLGCVMIDPVTGRRSLIIENVIRLIAGAFAIGLFAWIGGMTIKGRRAAQSTQDGGTATRA